MMNWNEMRTGYLVIIDNRIVMFGNNKEKCKSFSEVHEGTLIKFTKED